MSLTSETQLQDARYPTGKFIRPETVTAEERANAIDTLAIFPERLRNAVEGLDSGQLGTPYREGGWTVRQLVHHMADSHWTAVSRVKLALTQEWPAIQGYDEKAWANLHDSTAPVEWSLELVEALHARWVMLLQSLSDTQWQMGYVHPKGGRMSVEIATLLYAWHSRHHLAHITGLRAKEGW